MAENENVETEKAGKQEIEANSGNGDKDMGDLDKAEKMADNSKDQAQEKSNDSEMSR